MSDDPALTYLRDELLQLGVMLNEAKCEPWVLGLRLRNIAELFNRSIGGSMPDRSDVDELYAALDVVAGLLDQFGGYSGVPACDAAITLMQKHGVDRWSMQSQMERSAINAKLPTRDGAEGAGDADALAEIWRICDRAGEYSKSRLAAAIAVIVEARTKARAAAPPKPVSWPQDAPPLSHLELLGPDGMGTPSRAQIEAAFGVDEPAADNAMWAVLIPIYLKAICPAKERCACACKDWKWRDGRCEEDMARVNAILDCAPSAPVPPPDDDTMVDREALIAKYRAIHSKEAQFIALCIEAWSPSPAVAAEPVVIPPDIVKAINDLSDYADDLDATERPAVGEYDVTKDIKTVCQALIDALTLPVQPGAGEREAALAALVQELFDLTTPVYDGDKFINLTGTMAENGWWKRAKTALSQEMVMP